MARESTDMKTAKYLTKVLKDPTGIAVVLFRTFTAMNKAGFDEAQAMELAKYTLTLILGMGAMVE